MDPEIHRRWHATGAGSDQSPSLFRLSGRQATLFIVSLGFGFIVFTLVTSVGSDFVGAMIVSSSIPAAMFVFLMTLCCGRHEGYAGQWVEWKRLKSGGHGLLKIGKSYDH